MRIMDLPPGKARLPMSDGERRRAEWMLEYCAKNHENLKDSELDLLISFDEQFKRKNWLSARQMEVLENIYKNTK